jgi:hypothetical protein
MILVKKAGFNRTGLKSTGIKASRFLFKHTILSESVPTKGIKFLNSAQQQDTIISKHTKLEILFCTT